MYDNLSTTMQAYCSSFTVLQLVTQAVCLLSIVIRWILLPYYSCWPTHFSDEQSAVTAEAKARHCIAAQAVRDSLHVLTYGEMIDEDDETTESTATSCTVCLTDMKAEDCVWELRNCRHVFHKGCLDLWLDHDEHLTCPLCRAPLLGELARLPTASPPSEPSWAVERLLYLFGDDLICASSL